MEILFGKLQTWASSDNGLLFPYQQMLQYNIQNIIPKFELLHENHTLKYIFKLHSCDARYLGQYGLFALRILFS
jgi:hypothetical protein